MQRDIEVRGEDDSSERMTEPLPEGLEKGPEAIASEWSAKPHFGAVGQYGRNLPQTSEIAVIRPGQPDLHDGCTKKPQSRSRWEWRGRGFR